MTPLRELESQRAQLKHERERLRALRERLASVQSQRSVWELNQSAIGPPRQRATLRVLLFVVALSIGLGLSQVVAQLPLHFIR